MNSHPPLVTTELQKIKKEKAVEEQEKEEERKQEEERIRIENILSGNPLLKDKYAPSSEKSDLRLKRRWDDDVVFKNCSRAEPGLATNSIFFCFLFVKTH